MYLPTKAAENFIGPDDVILTVEKYGRGVIHDTYLVKLRGLADSFILQRMNTYVFKQPERIMHNLRVVGEHIRNLEKPAESNAGSRWEMLHIIPTGEQRDYFIDPEGGFWRALSFISGAYPLEEVAGLDNAREIGRALGKFHHLTCNIDPKLLHDTLPGFHNIEFYLKRYDLVLSNYASKEPVNADLYCREFIAGRRQWAPVLENGRKHGKLQMRVIHGDPKINNIMLDEQTGRAVSIIDLDTMKPGLLLYDIGDCLRSCCNVIGEDAENPAGDLFDLERCSSVLSGYMTEARKCLTGRDFALFYDAIRLLPFELGLRFYTDYLEDNIYFKTDYPVQNLNRAVVQFRLVESIEQQEDRIKSLIEKYCLM
ncbi:MAG: phosphotransferase [Deltaproteobacteria bacterium]|jgi:Ser/Thr protein kinase RdoA (MazF antagonist)|nr:phosphotransferase [Deltaproteobacteria bacterium]